jgi:predicted hydrocarbon binding protein
MGEEQAIAAILAAHEKELIDRGAALYNAGYDIALAAASQMANERVVEARLKDARFFIENRDEKVDYIQDMQDVVAALTDNKGEAE